MVIDPLLHAAPQQFYQTNAESHEEMLVRAAGRRFLVQRRRWLCTVPDPVFLLSLRKSYDFTTSDRHVLDNATQGNNTQVRRAHCALSHNCAAVYTVLTVRSLPTERCTVFGVLSLPTVRPAALTCIDWYVQGWQPDLIDIKLR